MYTLFLRKAVYNTIRVITILALFHTIFPPYISLLMDVVILSLILTDFFFYIFQCVEKQPPKLKTTTQKRAIEDTEMAGPSIGNHSHVKKAKLPNAEVNEVVYKVHSSLVPFFKERK